MLPSNKPVWLVSKPVRLCFVSVYIWGLETLRHYSSTLTVLGIPGYNSPLGFLNPIDTSKTVSDYYLAINISKHYSDL